jgi:hypothetical protein
MKQILIEKYIEPSEVIITGGCVTERWFDRNCNLHSFMGQPSYVSYKNGKITTKLWHKKGFIHRNRSLPDMITFLYSYNTTMIELWRDVNGIVLKTKTYKINKY